MSMLSWFQCKLQLSTCICRVFGVFRSRLYVTSRHSDKTRKCEHKTGTSFSCWTWPVLGHIFQTHVMAMITTVAMLCSAARTGWAFSSPSTP